MYKKKQSYAVVVLALGVLILLMPIVRNKIHENRNIVLLNQFKVEKKQYVKDYLENQIRTIKIKKESIEEEKTIDKEIKTAEVITSGAVNISDNKKNYEILGILQIDKIDLEKVIIKDASKENLKISVCSMNKESDLSKISNLVIAGHNSRSYGKDFNRLSELEKEDIVSVKVFEKTYNYKIYKKFIVKEDESWILSDLENKDIITLFTCTYQGKEKMRLVLRGIKI